MTAKGQVMRSPRNSIAPAPTSKPKKNKKGGAAPVAYTMDGKLHKDEQTEVSLQDMVGEVDFEQMVKYEYNKLHREYRLMESARQRLARMGSHVTKQTFLLQLLTNEKSELETDLVNVSAPHWKRVDKKSMNTILDILEMFEQSLTDISDSYRQVREMTRNVDMITKSLIEQKLKVQAMFGMSMTVPEVERRTRILEDRLYLYTTKCDTTLSVNKSIRVEINLMLQLRMVCYDTIVTVKRQSGYVRNKMSYVVDLSTQAYDARDEAMIKVRSLRDKSDKECKQHVLEVKELQRVLWHDTKLRTFMNLKNDERMLGETAAQRIDRINKAKMVEMDILLKAYTRSLKEILKWSHFDNMETLVQNYNEHEQRNFSCFKCITDLNHECTAWRDQIIEMQDELEVMYRKRKEDDKQWVADIELSGRELQDEQDFLDLSNQEWELAQEEMDQLVHLLDSVFNAADSSNTSIIRLLGNHEGITPKNAVMCMEVVEGRVAELLRLKEELHLRKVAEAHSGVLPVKKGTAQGKAGQDVKGRGGPFLPTVMLTGHSAEDDGDGDEDDKALSERPYTYAEMKARILEKLALKALAMAIVEESDTAFGVLVEDSEAASRSASKDSVMVEPPALANAQPHSATAAAGSQQGDEDEEDLGSP